MIKGFQSQLPILYKGSEWNSHQYVKQIVHSVQFYLRQKSMGKRQGCTRSYEEHEEIKDVHF